MAREPRQPKPTSLDYIEQPDTKGLSVTLANHRDGLARCHMLAPRVHPLRRGKQIA
jgi:hypothetical protein